MTADRIDEPTTVFTGTGVEKEENDRFERELPTEIGEADGRCARETCVTKKNYGRVSV